MLQPSGTPTHQARFIRGVFSAWAAMLLAACTTNSPLAQREPSREVRGTWITTTANTALATPADTANTMRRLREIGLNTVYVEVWKNGYTQYPSEVLRRTVGVDRRPALMPQDPSDRPESLKHPGRDLLQEMLIEAHRNGLITVAWFEYGFMAAHKSSNPHLRDMKAEWLSRDIKGSEIAPNGFVWMNPLHPDARQFLLDLVLEAIDHYDLDGIQLDDRIVWPYLTMGYDNYTRKVYAAEHNGAQPPADHTDPAWMRWRAEKVNEYAKLFVQEVRARRPGLLISLSPAVYPWSWENYLLEWPKWSAWTSADRNPAASPAARTTTPRWDEFIPQVYRFAYPAFEKTWLEQQVHMRSLGADRQSDMLAGIRLVGEGRNATWDELRQSIELVRKTGGGGHVHWFSRGVLDVFPEQLKTFYRGWVAHPSFPQSWRRSSVALFREPGSNQGGSNAWSTRDIPRDANRLIGFDGTRWEYVDEGVVETKAAAKLIVFVDSKYREVELIADRRHDMMRARR
ncbi:MAG: glycoside hydrolase family 10 protein [Burkholderiales bacterium]